MYEPDTPPSRWWFQVGADRITAFSKGHAIRTAQAGLDAIGPPPPLPTPEPTPKGKGKAAASPAPPPTPEPPAVSWGLDDAVLGEAKYDAATHTWVLRGTDAPAEWEAKHK